MRSYPSTRAKGEQHTPAFRAINPNGKVPAIVDTEGPGGKEARVFDSSAILLYLGEKTGQLIGSPADRPELLSWLFFIATGIGPFSGQAVHFQHAAPEKLALCGQPLSPRDRAALSACSTSISPAATSSSAHDYTIADISAWGWLGRCPVLPGATIRSPPFPTSGAGFTRSTRGRRLRGQGGRKGSRL